MNKNSSGMRPFAALLFFLLGVLGAATCLVFRRDRAIWALERGEDGACGSAADGL